MITGARVRGLFSYHAILPSSKDPKIADLAGEVNPILGAIPYCPSRGLISCMRAKITLVSLKEISSRREALTTITFGGL